MKTLPIAKIGDKISWVFDNTLNTAAHLRGKKYIANVAMVNIEEKVYGVYAEYGQDLIPFNDATIEEQTEPKEHTCKYCDALTTQDDEQCYRKTEIEQHTVIGC